MSGAPCTSVRPDAADAPGTLGLPQMSSHAGLTFLTSPANARSVVLFVHGLGGHRLDNWGAYGQPGAFILRLQLELPKAAVATYDYPSGLKTILANKALTLEAMACEWSYHLRDELLARFDTVVVVAHCLGGLLATLGTCRLLEASRPPALPDARGLQSGPQRNRHPGPKRLMLFLLDAPHNLPVGAPSLWLAGFMATLRFSTEDWRVHARLWREKVVATLGDMNGGGAGCAADGAANAASDDIAALRIEPYAIVSRQASWVTPLSPHADLPPARVCHAQLSHEQLPRAPAHGDFASYDFVLSRLQSLR